MGKDDLRCSVLGFPSAHGWCKGFFLLTATPVSALIIVVIVSEIDHAAGAVHMRETRYRGSMADDRRRLLMWWLLWRKKRVGIILERLIKGVEAIHGVIRVLGPDLAYSQARYKVGDLPLHRYAGHRQAHRYGPELATGP